MSRTLLTLLALKKRPLTHILKPFTLVAPDLTFTTDGMLQKWMFVSEDNPSIWIGYPHFQVWRRTEQGFIAVNGTSTHSYTPVRSGELNVYEYTLDPPAQIQSGDFVSWEHPSSRNSWARWLPLVVNNTGYKMHLVTSKSNDFIFETELLEYQSNPLIGVQMLGKNNCSQVRVSHSVRFISCKEWYMYPSTTCICNILYTYSVYEICSPAAIQIKALRLHVDRV